MISLPDEFVRPDYTGRSIANVPATVAALLGVPFAGLPPLAESLWRPLDGDVQRVVVLLVDAFGWNLFQQEESRLGGLLARAAVRGSLTSIFPSTTVAALSSLWTGVAPAQHGLLGLRLFMPEDAVLAQLIHFTPNFATFPNSLVDAGLEPAAFLHAPGFGEQLAAAGIPAYSFKGSDIKRSPLSQMHDRGVKKQYGYVTAAELFVQMRTLLEETAGSPLYAWAYWPAVDTLSHIYGPFHPAVAAEVRNITNLFQTELLDALSPAARRNTVFCLLADHGQVETPASQRIYLDYHPQLEKMLLMRPAGEPRTAYLYSRHGCQAAVLDYLHSHFSQAMTALSSEEALAAGLFGPEPYAPEAANRLGDVVAIMRSGYTLLTGKERKAGEHKGKFMAGRHGGMTAGEMEVPWLGMRLDP
jgi:predicted AlkP superfamily pyrophosphatase or phosphodiesterase